MLEILYNIDKEIFFFINLALSNKLFDIIFPFITKNEHWLLLYLLVFVWLFWKGGKEGRICGLILIITIILSDQISSSVIKNAIGRIRPCHVLEGINLLVPCGGGKSFPSSHAVNNFAAATVLVFFYKQYKWIFITIASLVAFSRVYVGVHYPSDVIGGAIIGIGIAVIILLLLVQVRKKFKF